MMTTLLLSPWIWDFINWLINAGENLWVVLLVLYSFKRETHARFSATSSIQVTFTVRWRHNNYKTLHDLHLCSSGGMCPPTEWTNAEFKWHLPTGLLTVWKHIEMVNKSVAHLKKWQHEANISMWNKTLPLAALNLNVINLQSQTAHETQAPLILEFWSELVQEAMEVKFSWQYQLNELISKRAHISW